MLEPCKLAPSRAGTVTSAPTTEATKECAGVRGAGSQGGREAGLPQGEGLPALALALTRTRAQSRVPAPGTTSVARLRPHESHQTPGHEASPLHAL